MCAPPNLCDNAPLPHYWPDLCSSDAPLFIRNELAGVRLTPDSHPSPLSSRRSFVCSLAPREAFHSARMERFSISEAEITVR